MVVRQRMAALYINSTGCATSMGTRSYEYTFLVFLALLLSEGVWAEVVGASCNMTHVC